MEEEQSDKTSRDLKKAKEVKRIQQEKKRKRINEDMEEEVEEDVTVEDGEKVFLSSRTGKQHYYEVIEEMKYIKGMLPTILLAMMVEWVLTYELKRKVNRNINGVVTRIMRECLIKLYCTLGFRVRRKGKKQQLLKKY